MTQPTVPGLYVSFVGGGGAGPPGPPGVTARAPLGAVRFIDPANSTGFASDANTGATANNVPPGSGPILTTVHLNALLFFTFLQASVTITYMSDDPIPGGVGLDTSTVDLRTFNLVFQGTPVTLHAAGLGTLNAGTLAINPAAAGGGQRQTAHTTDIADFGPFVSAALGGAATHPTWIVDVPTGDTALIALGTGSATASMTRPVSTADGAGALTIGHNYKIVRGSILKLASGPISTSSGGTLVLNDFAFTADSVGPVAADSFSGNSHTFRRCSYDGPLFFGGRFINCAFMSGMQGTFLATISAGLWVPTDLDEVTGEIVVDSDTFVTGPFALVVGGGFMSNIFVLTGFGAGIQIQSSGNTAAIQARQGGTWQNEALMWGNGNAGYGFVVFRAGKYLVANSTFPTVTGTLGDFAFSNDGTFFNKARAFDPATGEYTEIGAVANRATTWANLNVAIGAGGFFSAGDARSAFQPELDASLQI